ncbi:hypothetical protein L6164_035898 [Bauhinia variegata]|uniref:Uncharacterized protein n=1 Tax=Bauhinia variegata TaxID=167791 RepID=A0ACB9KG89_BAUVA|nr:hypothetical protein L6164_035898 [Bauhinia variegata]
MDHCYSTPTPTPTPAPSSSISTPACPRSCEEQPSSLKKRCLTAAKEQRSRFYILKRCIIMLLCWQKYEQEQH